MISEALDRGDFYASTGVELADYTADGKHIALKVRTTAWSRYRVQFIGRDGRVLAEKTDADASYTFTGSEGYVRVKVIESNGLHGVDAARACGAGRPHAFRTIILRSGPGTQSSRQISFDSSVDKHT